MAYCELVERPWIAESEDDPHYVEPLVLRFLNQIRVNAETAVRIVRLPFLDTIEWGDSDTMEFLADLSAADPEGLSQLLTYESVTERDDTPIQLIYLEIKDPTAASEIADQDWFRDGLQFHEHETVTLLQKAAIDSKRLFRYLMDGNVPWIPLQSGAAQSVLERLVGWSKFDEDMALRLIAMPFLETIDLYDFDVMRLLYDLSYTDPEALQRILSRPILADGITDPEASYVLIVYLEEFSPEAANAIKGLPWVQDGILYIPPENGVIRTSGPDVSEAYNIQSLVRLANRSPDFLVKLTTKQWIRDGINYSEPTSITDLDVIVSYDEQAALRMLELPLLETYTSDTLGALRDLVDARWEGREAFERELERLEATAGS